MPSDEMVEPVPPSPCVGTCALDRDTGLCRGCGRSVTEIANWSRLTPSEKQRVLDRLDRRRREISAHVHAQWSKTQHPQAASPATAPVFAPLWRVGLDKRCGVGPRLSGLTTQPSLLPRLPAGLAECRAFQTANPY